MPDDLVPLNGGVREYRFFPRPNSDAERAMTFPLGDIVIGEGDAVDSRVARDGRPHPGQGERISQARDGRQKQGGGFVRDYYEFALDDGGVYRVFLDLHAHKWFVDGVYD